MYDDGTRQALELAEGDETRLRTVPCGMRMRLDATLSVACSTAVSGCSYEGLAREFIPHGKGVMIFGNGTGGGIQLVKPGDKYASLHFSTAWSFADVPLVQPFAYLQV